METGQHQPRDIFPSTRWSVVIAAGNVATSNSRHALEQLCQVYWFPLYAYVRRRGHSLDDAQDLTQAFFAHLLEKQAIGVADRERGKFRAFLLGSLKHFLSHEWKRGMAAKRGGGAEIFSIDADEAERRYTRGPRNNVTPEAIYETKWAMAVLENATAALRAEYSASGRTPFFEALKGYLVGAEKGESYAILGARFGMSEGAIKVAVHRLRSRFRELLRAQIAETVETPEAVEEEIQHLIKVLGS